MINLRISNICQFTVRPYHMGKKRFILSALVFLVINNLCGSNNPNNPNDDFFSDMSNLDPSSSSLATLSLENASEYRENFSSSFINSTNIDIENEEKKDNSRKRKLETPKNEKNNPKKKGKMKWTQKANKRLLELHTELEPQFKKKSDLYKKISEILSDELNAIFTTSAVQTQYYVKMKDKDIKRVKWTNQMEKRFLGLSRHKMPYETIIEFFKIEFDISLTVDKIKGRVSYMKRASNYIHDSNTKMNGTHDANQTLLTLYAKFELQFENKEALYIKIAEEFNKKFKTRCSARDVKKQLNQIKKMENRIDGNGENTNTSKIIERIQALSHQNLNNMQIAQILKEEFKIESFLHNVQTWILLLKDELGISSTSDSANINESGIEEIRVAPHQNTPINNDDNNINIPSFSHQEQGVGVVNDNDNDKNNLSIQSLFEELF